METKIQVVESGSATAEIATLVFEGKGFTALGSTVDVEGGLVSAYMGDVPVDGKYRVSKFGGDLVGYAVRTSVSRRVYTAHGFHRLEYYSMELAGHRWHGKKSDAYNLIHFRKGKPVPTIVGQS